MGQCGKRLRKNNERTLTLEGGNTNKGTREGTEEEIKFVKMLNSDKKHIFWKVMGHDSPEDLFAVMVIYNKISKITGLKVKPKADAFIAKGNVPIEHLKNKEFFLDENDIEKYKLLPLSKTGISIKRPDSKDYQLLKLPPNTFKIIFGSYELGAGGSIYCLREEELPKNGLVLKTWNTEWHKFEKFFNFVEGIIKLKDDQEVPSSRLKVAKEVKKYSIAKIEKTIEANTEISKFVFQGLGNFEEPFTATWFYENNTLKRAGPIPFYVTTGSGRSRGDCTIVVKPKG